MGTRSRRSFPCCTLIPGNVFNSVWTEKGTVCLLVLQRRIPFDCQPREIRRDAHINTTSFRLQLIANHLLSAPSVAEGMVWWSLTFLTRNKDIHPFSVFRCLFALWHQTEELKSRSVYYSYVSILPSMKFLFKHVVNKPFVDTGVL